MTDSPSAGGKARLCQYEKSTFAGRIVCRAPAKHFIQMDVPEGGFMGYCDRHNPREAQ